MKLKEIAEFVNGVLQGPADLDITGIAKIEEAKSGELTWFSHPRYKKWLSKTQASCVVVLNGEDVSNINTMGHPALAVIKVANLAIAMESLLLKFYPLTPLPAAGISKLSTIGQNVKIGKNISVGDFVCIGDDSEIGDNTIVMSGVYIGNKVKIGKDCQIHPNSVIKEDVFLGSRVIIGAGTVIGSDGFAYNRIEGKYKRMPHRGGVILEDDVEIGANSTIDKSVVGNTVIKKGTKLDNLVHIAHNVNIGEDAILCAQVGIAGSVNIGNNVVIAGQAGVPDHITVGNNVVIAAQSGVTKDIPEGITVSGFPARPHIESNRAYSLLIDLPDLFKRVKKLEEQLLPRKDVPCKKQ